MSGTGGKSEQLSETAARDERVAPTAHYTAYAWFQLGMPYAEWFKTPQGARLYWALRLSVDWLTRLSPRVPSMLDYLEYRHRAMDHTLTRLNADRVIELGAGLSRRGATWALDHGVSYVEVDLPHMTLAKRRLISRLPKAVRDRLAPRLSLVSADVLANDFSAWLTAQLEQSKRPVVIAEGLLGYFSEAEREQIVQAVATALRQASSSQGGSFLCDLRTRSQAARTRAAVAGLKAVIKLVTRFRGARSDFSSHDAIRELFTRAGFDSARPIRTAEVSELSHLRNKDFPVDVWLFSVRRHGLS